MDLKSKRKLKEVIRGIIADGFSGTQKDVAKSLKAHGFKVTQSTISRTMTEMGIVKESHRGDSVYRIAPVGKNEFRGTVAELIQSIEHNGSLIVMKTRPGTAMFVAGFIDHSCHDTVMGTVAGDDTLLIAPRKVSQIKDCLQSIKENLNSL